MNNGGVSSGGAAPTGCYKCGRPGHWSRDCPSDPTTTTPHANNDSSNLDLQPESRSPLSAQKPKQKAPRRTRPKLTPDLLLSDAGIGHILRYFPKAFKCRGRGHEVSDLQHLLRLYAEWHSRLLPYYSFDQFIHKVEQVGASKRVKLALNKLQDRIANGIDPSKLHEPEVEQVSIDEQDAQGGLDMPSNFEENNVQIEKEKNIQEDIMPEDMWEEAMQENSGPIHVEVVAPDASRVDEAVDLRAESNATISNQNEMSEEQKARMEANRLKALERAAARTHSSRAS